MAYLSGTAPQWVQRPALTWISIRRAGIAVIISCLSKVYLHLECNLVIQLSGTVWNILYSLFQLFDQQINALLGRAGQQLHTPNSPSVTQLSTIAQCDPTFHHCPSVDGDWFAWNKLYSTAQLGTLLGVPGCMELLASPGQSCPEEGQFADESPRAHFISAVSCIFTRWKAHCVRLS